MVQWIITSGHLRALLEDGAAHPSASTTLRRNTYVMCRWTLNFWNLKFRKLLFELCAQYAHFKLPKSEKCLLFEWKFLFSTLVSYAQILLLISLHNSNFELNQSLLSYLLLSLLSLKWLRSTDPLKGIVSRYFPKLFKIWNRPSKTWSLRSRLLLTCPTYHLLGMFGGRFSKNIEFLRQSADLERRLFCEGCSAESHSYRIKRYGFKTDVGRSCVYFKSLHDAQEVVTLTVLTPKSV